MDRLRSASYPRRIDARSPLRPILRSSRLSRGYQSASIEAKDLSSRGHRVRSREEFFLDGSKRVGEVSLMRGSGVRGR